jgi:uncharacterized protein (DUF3084 family)
MESEDSGPSALPDPRADQSQPGEVDLERRESAVEARETVVEERETTVEARELTVEARETAQGARMQAAQGMRDAADKRDVVSGARDVAADKREHDLDQADMLNSEIDYGAHWPERRNAGIDRAHAKDDRTASHADRVAMTEGNDKHDCDET